MAVSLDEEHCAKDDSTIYYPNLCSCLSVTLVYTDALVGTHLTTGTKDVYGHVIFTKMQELAQGEGNLLSIFLIGNVQQFTTNQNQGTKNMRLPRKLVRTLAGFFGNARILSFDSVAQFGESNAVRLERTGTAAPFTDCTGPNTYTTPALAQVPDGLYKLRRLEENPTMYQPPTAVGFALNGDQAFTAIQPTEFHTVA